jgi:hypothetical protein
MYRVGVVALIAGLLSMIQVNAQVLFPQPFLKSRLPQYIQKTGKPFPSIFDQRAGHDPVSNEAAARKQDDRKLPLGFRKESWKPELNAFSLDSRKTIVVSDQETGVMRAYRLSLTDTTGIDKMSFPGTFTNKDAFNFLAGTDGTDLPFTPILSSIHSRDRTLGNFTELVARERKGGQLVTTRSLKREEAFPSILLPSKIYSVIDYCSSGGNRYIETGTGKPNDGLWETELLVSQVDCNAGTVVAEFKENRLFNASIQEVEERSYIKQGGDYSLVSYTKREYTESGDDRSYESVLENRKYEFEYDEFGVALTSTFVRNDTDWVQTGRTIRESTTAQGKTIVVAANEELGGSEWFASYRETYHFDDQKRDEFYSVEYYVEGQWILDNYFKNAFYKLRLPGQVEYYSQGGRSGQKWIYSYNSSDMLVGIETQVCANLADCQNGIYQPTIKTMGETSLALDYLVGYTYRNGQWEETDSTAQAYDHQDDLTEIFFQNFKSGDRIRYSLDYEPEIVAGLNDSETDAPLAYPNPVHNELRISSPVQSAYNVFVYDIMGRAVGAYQTPDVINVSAYPPGVYMLLIEANGLRHWQKVVKN